MNAWEQRARKLEARRRRMQKHGRSLLTAVSAAEKRRASGLKAAGRGRQPGKSATSDSGDHHRQS